MRPTTKFPVMSYVLFSCLIYTSFSVLLSSLSSLILLIWKKQGCLKSLPKVTMCHYYLRIPEMVGFIEHPWLCNHLGRVLPPKSNLRGRTILLS